MLVVVARCLQTQSILNRLTIEQWSTIEKSPFSVTSPSFIQYESRLSGFHACMNVSCDLCFSQSQLRIAYFHANGKYYVYMYVCRPMYVCMHAIILWLLRKQHLWFPP